MKNNLLIFFTCLLLASCSSDDDTVTVQQCAKPTNISANAITFESAEIIWSDTNNAGSFTVEYGLTGFMLGSGTTINTTETTALLTNLLANTNYDIYIKTACSVENTSMYSDVFSFTTAAPLVVPQLLPNLSDLNLFSGNLNDLTPSSRAFEYNLNTPLFTDYAHKQRLIALPPGTTMDYVDNGFPDFPNNTVISKTFYYFNDERNESLGKTIIETRILIKINGTWELGNYKWNDSQTDAVLDDMAHTVPVSFVNNNGITNTINYGIPSMQDCIDCHNSNNIVTPIGPKLRTMNFNNQLQDFINSGYLSNLSDPTTVTTLPNWEDTSYTQEERARAYFDVNCAHCHSDGGYCQFQSELRLTYETPFSESMIFERKASIDNRMRSYNPGISMPLIGTSLVHSEGYGLIREYLNSL
ncbi:conserved hypothetical protein, HNE_0200 family [Bizionia echini]|uniref:Fibronectin type-III domain-containing protein n=1 Tax=Bizionia echini TaxID=649333 RepID=A0A1I5D1W7_9FLAO|nr:hypothetical protein [Bizionia echini]SFN93106.1 conserved hypothetical protein, HNE_0200 family [Bizionia echini]